MSEINMREQQQQPRVCAHEIASLQARLLLVAQVCSAWRC
jgi:hypothetical protein